jgi:hypothetical protein
MPFGFQTARQLFFGRGDAHRTATRACCVVGLLLLVLAWRLDASVRTAYVSGWTGRTIRLDRCADCRLPGHPWLIAHGAAGVVAVMLLAAALVVWRARVVPNAGAELLWLGRIDVALALVIELGAAYLRDRADNDKGSSLLAYAFACDAAALVALAIFALAVAAQADSGSLSVRIRRFVERHGVNLVGVVALALMLDVVGQTSGQAIDSIRGWVVGDARGMSRLAFGLTTSFLLALVVYESSIRLSLVRAADGGDEVESEVHAGWWLGAGVALLAVGIPAGLFLPLGYGLAVLGGILVVLGLFELPDLGVPDKPQEPITWPWYGNATSEYLAIVPLLAVSAIALAGAVDAALSDGAHLHLRSLLVLIPCLALGLGSILMTGAEYTPLDAELRHPTRAAWLASLVGVALLTAFILLWHSEAVAAGVGFALVAAAVLYAWVLFHATAKLVNSRSEFLVVLPVAIWAGIFVAFAVHWDVFGVSDIFGVFGLINVGLAALLAALHYVVLAGLRHRPPNFFWSLGIHRLPVLTILLVWWIAAGLLFAPHSLHDARVVRRAASADSPTLLTAFPDWRAAQGAAWSKSSSHDAPLPLVVVAAHGGGIRAAYWTALVLDCVVGAQSGEKTAPDYEHTCTNSEHRRTADDQRAAARRIFLLSGVSGGAVGLYAYARQLLADGKLSDGWVDKHLGGDFAAATIGWTLFHDLPNHLLGIHPETGGDCGGMDMHGQCFAQDRAAVLEDTFDRKWTGTAPNLRATWEQRSSDAPGKRELAKLVPIVVDNSTVVGGKTRAVTSALELSNWPLGETPELTDTNIVDKHPLAGTAQVLSALCRSNDMRLSTAALLASRFPYVNPSGRLNGDCEPNRSSSEPSPCAKDEIDCEMSLVDGGYTDNSGLFTIEAVLPSLRRLIEESNSTYPNRRKLALVVVEVDNHYRAALGEPPSAKAGASETLVPITTALGAHGAIETFARADAYRLVPKTCALTISPALHPGLAAPLGWELSRGARHDLQDGLVRDSDKPRKEQPIELVKRLQRWLGDSVPNDTLAACVPKDPPLPLPKTKKPHPIPGSG